MKTTREEAKENIHDNLVDNLQGLLEKNYDAEKGFKKAVENAKNGQLKAQRERKYYREPTPHMDRC